MFHKLILGLFAKLKSYGSNFFPVPSPKRIERMNQIKLINSRNHLIRPGCSKENSGIGKVNNDRPSSY